jgi:Tripartite tricarboxylate transporter TctA family
MPITLRRRRIRGFPSGNLGFKAGRDSKTQGGHRSRVGGGAATAPYHLLYLAFLMFCATGVFSLNHSNFDLYLVALFRLLGYIFRKLDAEPAPMLLAFILAR